MKLQTGETKRRRRSRRGKKNKRETVNETKSYLAFRSAFSYSFAIGLFIVIFSLSIYFHFARNFELFLQFLSITNNSKSRYRFQVSVVHFFSLFSFIVLLLFNDHTTIEYSIRSIFRPVNR